MRSYLFLPNTFIGNRSEVEQAASEYVIYQIGKYLQIAYLPFITIIGFIFNVLSSIVLLRPKNRQNPFCVFVAGLAVWDMLELSANSVGWILTIPQDAMTPLDCQILTFVCQIASGTTTFLLVAITADRCLLVSFTGHVFPWRTPSFSGGVILVMLVLGTLTALPSGFNAHKLDQMTCAGWTHDQAGEFAIFLVIALGFSPCTAIFIMNLTIIRVLRKAGRMRRLHSRPCSESGSRPSSLYNDTMFKHSDTISNISSISQEDDDCVFAAEDGLLRSSRICCCYCPRQSRHSAIINHRPHMIKHERTQTTLLLTMSFTFLLLRIPQYIQYVVYSYIDPKHDPLTYATYVLVYNIVNKMHITDCAINAMLVCAISSPFRTDLCGLLRCLCCRQQRTAPLNNDCGHDVMDTRF